MKQKLPSPKKLFSRLQMSNDHMNFVSHSRSVIKNILLQHDHRLPIVVGPCSIHDFESAIEYGKRLRDLHNRVCENIFLVMRAYVEKPRTRCGWRGFLNDPNLNGSHDIAQGIILSRKLFLTLTEMKIPISMEFLNPLTANYVCDLVSWGFIGARTSSSQTHRELASAMDMAIGFKNSVDGNIMDGINGALFARIGHKIVNIDDDGHIYTFNSTGNKFTHVVLRGSSETSNYSNNEIKKAKELQASSGLTYPLLIDCSHGNSHKNHLEQAKVFKNVVNQIKNGNKSILGLMMESNIEDGSQSSNSNTLKKGVSITDPCIGWRETEKLILWCNERLNHCNIPKKLEES